MYAAGFSRNEEVYERAGAGVCRVLDQLEERLASSRYLVGDTPTEADWRLFPTCVRFDSAYYSHFKCNVRRIVDYPNLRAYTRDLRPAAAHRRDRRYGPDQAGADQDGNPRVLAVLAYLDGRD